MTKIVVTNDQGFTTQQRERLSRLGEVTFHETLPVDGAEYLNRIAGADVICSGTAGLKDAYGELKDVYVTVAFVSVAFVDLEVLRANRVLLSNAPGANRHAVAEWVLAMMLFLSRDLQRSINTADTYRNDGALPPPTCGLAGRNLTVLGRGHVGQRVGELAEAFSMNVRYFQKGDDLATSVADADVIVDALSSNPSTLQMLDERFFASTKEGTTFITVSRPEILDENAMLAALDDGRLCAVATDCGGILVGDTDDPYYRRMAAHPKIAATPHVAYSTTKSATTGADIMIDNVEAYLAGKPINLVT